MREEICHLLQLGKLPDSDTISDETIDKYEHLLGKITPPLTDEEACALTTLFGPDECYGLAFTMVHLIETAPSWPIKECLNSDNRWIRRLRDAAIRAGLL